VSAQQAVPFRESWRMGRPEGGKRASPTVHLYHEKGDPYLAPPRHSYIYEPLSWAQIPWLRSR
jgi:hypothetical protein